MNRMVVIEDSTILSLLNNKDLAKAIPCLANRRESFLNQSGGGCGSCARKRQQKQREELIRIKTCLASMSPEKKNDLKARLNAQQLRIVYVNSAGQTIQMTF